MMRILVLGPDHCPGSRSESNIRSVRMTSVIPIPLHRPREHPGSANVLIEGDLFGEIYQRLFGMTTHTDSGISTMTWLSRLLPQSPSLQRLADPNQRTRQSKRRRRMATLERLEDRTLLSNVSVSENLVTHALTITGDAHNDNFIIQENSAASGGQVSVSPGNLQTTIGGLHTPFTSQQGILTLTVILNGTSNNLDVVQLLGTAPAASAVKSVTITTPTVVSPNFGESLDFTGNNLNNPGTFSLTAYGTLNASLDKSTFNAVTITQIGCCPAHVELGNDHVSGSVNVSEGYGNGDTITLTNDTFGWNSSRSERKAGMAHERRR